MNNLPIVYTPATNLRKSADMAVGQVRCKGRLELDVTFDCGNLRAEAAGWSGRSTRGPAWTRMWGRCDAGSLSAQKRGLELGEPCSRGA